MEQTTIFDFLDEEDAAYFKPKKSTDWKWTMANDYPKETNGLKVFSCFACGGGSTMGYKLAGCEVVGCCEIDPRMNEVYIKNHHPKHNFLMDIRKFNEIPNEELPEELLNLDILDGSPPCTTFSMSGLLKGEAWSYVQKIYADFHKIGYKVKHWLVMGEYMGVPQTRHRAIFVALRDDVDFDLMSLDMSFNYEPVLFGEIRSEQGTPIKGETLNWLCANFEYGDDALDGACIRLKGKGSFFNNRYIYDERVAPTLPAKCVNVRVCDKKYMSCQDIINASTFPQDYDFITHSVTNVHYICGMSVPPIMIKRVVTRLIESGIFEGSVISNAKTI